MQGLKPTEIARKKNISSGTVRSYIDQWESHIKTRANQDPEVFDRILENSLKFIETYDYMLKNAWGVHDDAKENGVSSTQLQALKLVQEITAQQARFYQLLGPRMDTGYLDKAKRAERVNEVLSTILQSVVKDCERCMPMVWGRLQEAFSLMNKDATVVEEHQHELAEEN